MDKRIIFFGPVQLNNPGAVGGGESGNRKTIKILKDLGFLITVLEKPYITNGIFTYFVVLMANFFKIIFYSLKGYKHIQITGYYLNSIYFEFLTILISKLMGLSIVYELRAGGMIEGYNNRSNFYRYVFKLSLKFSNYILCQGSEYVTFNKEVLDIESLYYPNFILDKFIEPNDTTLRKTEKSASLVYFGRVNENKNITFLLEIARELKDRNFQFDLEIIGKYTSEYEKYLRNIIDQNKLNTMVILNPALNFIDLSKKLKRKHFFVFPSREKREGHSNALTEAMVFGVVPVASNQGFNKTVIGVDFLVSDTFNAHNYAGIIESVWKDNWEALSNKVYTRVKDNYTESKTIELLRSIYKL